jgi:hypothetical protein
MRLLFVSCFEILTRIVSGSAPASHSESRNLNPELDNLSCHCTLEEQLQRPKSRRERVIETVSGFVLTDAGPFVVNEFNNIRTLQMTKDMQYIDPSSLQSDPVDQKIVTCARSLASMATTNQFVDDGSCQ